MDAKNPVPVLTWEELLVSIENGEKHPDQTLWHIYHYLKANYISVGSQISRTLLVAYLKLRPEKPALINSCMLSLAVKISYQYKDFQFPEFLRHWGYGATLLRREDCLRERLENGREVMSLRERVEKALTSYRLHHPDCGYDNALIRTFYAVKVFETLHNGRKRRTVKLVDAGGSVLVADSHLFPCRPFEIQGKVFDVITRVSKKAGSNVYAEEAVLSNKAVHELFKPIVGLVGSFDVKHAHCHIFDAQSRHYVAERPRAVPSSGSYILFCPVIMQNDNFKCAVIISVLPPEEGRKAFGMYEAVVKHVDYDKDYLKYELKVCPPDPNADDTYTSEAFMPLSLFTNVSDRRQVKVGSHISLVLFLKRGSDGIKHNHVAEARLL